MVLASLLVATSFPVVGEIAGELSSLVLTLTRFVIASILFVPLVVIRHGAAARPTGRSLARYAALSAPLVGFFYCMFEALRTATPVSTGALFTLIPVFSAVFAFFIVRERLGVRRIIALLAGMVGAAWVVFRGEPSRVLEMDLSIGDGIFVIGTCAYGLYASLIKLLHRGEPMVVMTFWTLVTGTGWLFLLSAGELSSVLWSAMEPRVLGWIAYLAFFTTLITFLLTQMAVTVIGPTRTMAYTYLTPALVALLAWMTGDEAIGWAAVPGIALTLVAMGVLQTQRNSS